MELSQLWDCSSAPRTSAMGMGPSACHSTSSTSSSAPEILAASSFMSDPS